MAIVEATETGAMVGTPIKMTVAVKAASQDTLLFSGTPGVVPLFLASAINAALGLETDGYKYNDVRVNHPSAGAYAATATSIAYDTATASTRTAGGYYLFNPATGEMIYVVVDSGPTGTSGTLTVRRGALGTTASTVTDNHYLIIMNSIVLTGSIVGKEVAFYLELPNLVKADMLG
jgi:hypothetical protein